MFHRSHSWLVRFSEEEGVLLLPHFHIAHHYLFLLQYFSHIVECQFPTSCRNHLSGSHHPLKDAQDQDSFSEG